MASPYAASWTRALWVLAVVAGVGYGIFLITVALRLPAGADLTGQFALQPAVKAARRCCWRWPRCGIRSPASGAGWWPR
jgi:hypothetical protein